MSLKLGTQNIAGIPTGLIDTVNGKADANNVYTKTEIDTKPQIIAPYLKTTYVNGTSGYRIWSDGYCEQWGGGQSGTISLLKKYRDTNYIVMTRMYGGGGTMSWGELGANLNKQVDKFTIGTSASLWETSGYLAQGEY